MQKFSNYFLILSGVGDKIEFIIGDFFEVYKNLEADIIFLAPPWVFLYFYNREGQIIIN